jgi:catechol 2,3-dioxygenase-like lactoylglutathione lyase family enzyme
MRRGLIETRLVSKGCDDVANTPQESRPSMRLATVCIDCANADEMADFYGRLLGWEVTSREPDWVLMRDPARGTGLSFQAEAWYRPPVWPEQPGELDKMLHLDIRVDDLTAAVAHALESGGRLAEHQPQPDVRVLLDPAGHPFCLFLD